MKRLPLNVFTEIMNGKLEVGAADLTIHDVVTRTKRLSRGALLFDLHYDKHLNQQLCQKNFPYAIVTDRPAYFAGLGGNITVVRVADINKAYWEFVDFYRNHFAIPVIGVTGTCGKTTTKEMIKHILAGTYRVNATYKSYNALFRNLRYLLEIDEDTQTAVYEMGVALAGNIKTSCRYFKPQVGVITNIGIDHLMGFRSLAAYIEAKAELLEGMAFQGTLILNGDDENIRKIDLRKFHGEVIYFGAAKRSHFRISQINPANGIINFLLQCRERTYPLTIPGYSEFNVYNAAAAMAAAHAVGMEIEAAGARLASFQNLEKHFEFKAGINGSTIIDDTWSTNPTSAEAALRLLKSLAQGKKTIAVLGEMSLLGNASAAYHFETGEKIAAIGIDQLIVLGAGALEMGRGAIQKGMDQAKVYFCQDAAETHAVLQTSLDENTIALVKTSMLASYDDLMDQIIVRTR